MNCIEISHLHKSFRDVHAVDDISFSVHSGELFAFLGLNGAGKSTTISIISGQLEKDAGTVCINGQDIDVHPDAAKRDIGLVFQNSVLDKVLSVKENLRCRAALYGITGAAFDRRLAELSGLLDLAELLPRVYGKLSGGQRRRIDVARALFHDPRILILDEPTTGLDPQSRQMVWNVVEQLRKTEGLTVFLTTHYMEEAAEADDVVILDRGHIVASGTPGTLKDRYAGDFVKLYQTAPERVIPLGCPFTQENGYLKIPVTNAGAAARLIRQYPELFDDFEVVKGKMDDVFLAVTGKNGKEEA